MIGVGNKVMIPKVNGKITDVELRAIGTMYAANVLAGGNGKINMPAGVEIGDLCFGVVLRSHHYVAASSTNLTSGWTLIDTKYTVPLSVAIGYKVIDGSEGSSFRVNPVLTSNALFLSFAFAFKGNPSFSAESWKNVVNSTSINIGSYGIGGVPLYYATILAIQDDVPVQFVPSPLEEKVFYYSSSGAGGALYLFSSEFKANQSGDFQGLSMATSEYHTSIHIKLS